MCKEMVPILLICEEFVQMIHLTGGGGIVTDSSHLRGIGTNSSHPKTGHMSRIFISLHVRNYQRIIRMCAELLQILHTSEIISLRFLSQILDQNNYGN